MPNNIMTLLVFLFTIATISVVSGIIFSKVRAKNKRENVSEEYNAEYAKINETYDGLEGELERTRKISKNEESIKLYTSWLNEYNLASEKKEDIDSLIVELNDYVAAKEHKNFLSCSQELEGKLFKFQEDLEILYKKVKQYTNYELENTRISLTLKDRIKDLTKTFEQKLQFLEIYNRSFTEEITLAQSSISEFENLQKIGDYPEGRTVLKACNRKIDKIDFILKIILNFHEYLSQLDNDIIMMSKIGEEIEKIGFSLNIQDFSNRVKIFTNERENILGDIAQLNFESEINKEVLKELETRIQTLDHNITEFKDIVEEKFNFIKEIIEVIGKNDKLIAMSDDLIKSAIVEKDEILTLYEVPEIKQIKKLDKEIQTFELFKADYVKLMDIIHNAKEDFVALKRRIEQSNQYLIKLIKNIEMAGHELRAIRNDEISARENIVDYLEVRVDIDLYLRRYNHKTMMSADLSNLVIDLDVKLKSLKDCLDQEPLNISEVRKLDQSVARLIKTITTESLDHDVKQRNGAKLLIQYLSRYNTSDEMNLIIKRMHGQFKAHEYKKILRDAREMLMTLTTNGEAVYFRVVSKVVVSPFEPILKKQIEDNQ